MKILVAIKSEHWKGLSDDAMRWCGRLGFDFKVFAPRNKRRKYLEQVWDANYNYYLAMPDDIVITKTDMDDYALSNGYNLLVEVPQSLVAWRKGTAFWDKEIKYAYEAIDKARVQFIRQPRKKVIRFNNGVIMRRIP